MTRTRKRRHISYVEFFRRYLGSDWGQGATHRGNLAWSRIMHQQMSEMLATRPEMRPGELAAHFECSPASITRWKRKIEKQGRSGHHQPTLFAVNE